MTKVFELYFEDLTENAQKEILQKTGVKTPYDMNWDVFPITTIEFEDESEEEDD